MGYALRGIQRYSERNAKLRRLRPRCSPTLSIHTTSSICCHSLRFMTKRTWMITLISLCTDVSFSLLGSNALHLRYHHTHNLILLCSDGSTDYRSSTVVGHCLRFSGTTSRRLVKSLQLPLFTTNRIRRTIVPCDPCFYTSVQTPTDSWPCVQYSVLGSLHEQHVIPTRRLLCRRTIVRAGKSWRLSEPAHEAKSLVHGQAHDAENRASPVHVINWCPGDVRVHESKLANYI